MKTIRVKNQSLQSFFALFLSTHICVDGPDGYGKTSVYFAKTKDGNILPPPLQETIHFPKTDKLEIGDTVIFEIEDRGQKSNLPIIAEYEFKVWVYDDVCDSLCLEFIHPSNNIHP